METYKIVNQFVIRDGKRILQCHSKGDKRFSPFFCYVTAFGVRDSIENHYQKSKVFYRRDLLQRIPVLTWRDAKDFQKDPNLEKDMTKFILPNGLLCPIEYQVYGWYSSLWLKYLDSNPDLVEEAKEFDDYEDIFKHNFPLCQADCIRLYCKYGREALFEASKDFLIYLRDRYGQSKTPNKRNK